MPNRKTQLKASPASSCSRRRDLNEKANPKRNNPAAGMKSPGDVVIASGKLWATLSFADVKVEVV
jgi:hypothetical protein